MLHSIPEDKINDLSLEMIIYYMFSEYPEIIDGYNNEALTILRKNQMLEPIEGLRLNLIGINKDLIEKGHEEGEQTFINGMKKMCIDFIKEKKSMINMNIIAQKMSNIKIEEKQNKESDNIEANSLINNFNF